MYPKGAPTSTSVRVEDMVASGEMQTSRPVRTLSGEELRQEYWYVYNDLRRIAIIAGALFVVLIVLAFII